jgi:hypothetical protein
MYLVNYTVPSITSVIDDVVDFSSPKFSSSLD